MATNNLTVLFWLFKSRQNKSGNAPIYLRITYQTKRKNIATGFYLRPERWDKSRQMVKGGLDDAKQINEYIIHTRNRLMELFNGMLKQQQVSLDGLVEQFLGRDKKVSSLLSLVEEHNNDIKKRVGIDYAFSTYQKYDILNKKVAAFIAYKYPTRKDFELKELTLKFIAEFDYYLKSHDRNEQNTVTKYLKNLKRILSYGVLHEWIEINPFTNYKVTYKDVDRVYLTTDELMQIEQKTFANKRLELTKDLFLFQCYTGLAFTDMIQLNHSHITQGVDGNKWIISRRKKTGNRTAIPLIPKAIRILNRYTEEVSSPDLFIFPRYAIQTFNSYLHEIADVCGITKSLTSHAGRRTFATTVALSNGISLETISKILGHSSTKITSIYAVVTDHKVSMEMSKLMNIPEDLD